MENKITLTAHRGWRAKYPENTMRGFREVMKLDIDAIEMGGFLSPRLLSQDENERL